MHSSHTQTAKSVVAVSDQRSEMQKKSHLDSGVKVILNQIHAKCSLENVMCRRVEHLLLDLIQVEAKKKRKN
jgi:hypothetical protein